MADGPEFCILRMRVFLLHFPRSHKMALLSSFSTLRFIPCPLYECPALKLNQEDKFGLSILIFGKRRMILGLKWFYFLISYKWWDCDKIIRSKDHILGLRNQKSITLFLVRPQMTTNKWKHLFVILVSQLVFHQYTAWATAWETNQDHWLSGSVQHLTGRVSRTIFGS